MWWPLLGSRQREKEAEAFEALQRAQEEKMADALEAQERQRERDENQKVCDEWNAARKAEIIGYQPNLSIRTNAAGQRFLCIGEQYQLPSWLIVHARIKDHGQPKHLETVFRWQSSIIRGGHSVIAIQMASGREWNWYVPWCHAEIALDVLKTAIAECRGIA